MIGSVGGVCMVRLHQFVGRANDHRLVTGQPAHAFDTGSHRGVGNVPKVPRDQVVDSVRYCDCNMGSILRGIVRNRSHIEQPLCEFGGILGRIQ